MSVSPGIKFTNHHDSLQIFEVLNDLVVRTGKFSTQAAFNQWRLTLQTNDDGGESAYLSIHHYCETAPRGIHSLIILTISEAGQIREALPKIEFVDNRKEVQHG